MATLLWMAKDARATHVEALLIKSGRTKSWLADSAGISRSKLGEWLNGAYSPKDATIWGKLEDILNKDIEQRGLTFAGGSALGSDPPSPSSTPGLGAQEGVGRRKFPIMGNVGAASFGVESYEPDPDDFEEFSDTLYRVNRFAVRVRGNSMEPQIQDKDIILVHPSTMAPEGYLTVVKTADHCYLLKVLKYTNGEPILCPLNGEYDPIKPQDGFTVAGYVVGLSRSRGRRAYMEIGDDEGLTPADLP